MYNLSFSEKFLCPGKKVAVRLVLCCAVLCCAILGGFWELSILIAHEPRITFPVSGFTIMVSLSCFNSSDSRPYSAPRITADTRQNPADVPEGLLAWCPHGRTHFFSRNISSVYIFSSEGKPLFFHKKACAEAVFPLRGSSTHPQGVTSMYLSVIPCS